MRLQRQRLGAASRHSLPLINTAAVVSMVAAPQVEVSREPAKRESRRSRKTAVQPLYASLSGGAAMTGLSASTLPLPVCANENPSAHFCCIFPCCCNAAAAQLCHAFVSAVSSVSTLA